MNYFNTLCKVGFLLLISKYSNSQSWSGSSLVSGHIGRNGTVSIIGNTSGILPTITNDYQFLVSSDNKNYVFKAMSNHANQHAINVESNNANSIAFSVKYKPSPWTIPSTSSFLPSNNESFAVLSDGKVFATELTIKNFPVFPDYVFKSNYKLLSLLETEKYIAKHSRLPKIPSASEIAKSGLSIGTMQVLQMEKIEELTLHAIELKKENEKLKRENEKLKADVARILNKLNMD